MFINGIDISTYGGKLVSFTALPAQKDYIYEFLNRSSLVPAKVQESERKFKVITIELEIWANTEQQFDVFSGKLTDEMTDCEMVMDDRNDVVYKGHLQNVPEVEMITTTSGKLTFEFYAICEGIEKKHVFTDNITVQVEGDSKTPAILEITSAITLQTLQIVGLTKEPSVVKNLEKGIPFIIDGEKCLVMQGGENKFSYCDMWQFPTLSPGTAKISLSVSCSALLRYKPRYV